jgi:hypothetical protein
MSLEARWSRAERDGRALDASAARWARWTAAMNCEGVFLRQRDARTPSEHLFAPQSATVRLGATVWSMATLWRAQRHAQLPGASLGRKMRLSGGKSAAAAVGDEVSRKPSLSALQSVVTAPNGAFGIVGATLCFSETLHAPRCVSHALREKRCAPGRARRVPCDLLALAVTPRRKKRRRRAPCAFRRDRPPSGLSTALSRGRTAKSDFAEGLSSGVTSFFAARADVASDAALVGSLAPLTDRRAVRRAEN